MTVNVEEGAMTTLYVATHPQAPKVDGSYFDACLPVSPSTKATWVIDWFYSATVFFHYYKKDVDISIFVRKNTTYFSIQAVWINSLFRQNVPITFFLTDFTQGSWKKLKSTGSKEMIWKSISFLNINIRYHEVFYNCSLFYYFTGRCTHQEVLWNYSLERLGHYVTEDLLTDLKVDLEELGVVKTKK